jgi:hypothetical protein
VPDSSIDKRRGNRLGRELERTPWVDTPGQDHSGGLSRSASKSYEMLWPVAMVRPSSCEHAVPPWDIVITEWALDSYLDLKHRNVFSSEDYWTTLRPDVELLAGGMPSPHPKFQSPTFWGPARQGNVIIRDGYEMKWRQLGPGKVQLRLLVTPLQKSVFLCACYEKQSIRYEQRKLARFKTHINLIAQGRYVHRGRL